MHLEIHLGYHLGVVGEEPCLLQRDSIVHLASFRVGEGVEEA